LTSITPSSLSLSYACDRSLRRYHAHLKKVDDQPYVPCVSLLLKTLVALNSGTPKWYRERPGQQEVNFDWVRFVGERVRYVIRRQEMLLSSAKVLPCDSVS
jgi:hypothetical protein